jgi:spore coat polysaccharide biosynthesis protein SpsF
MIILIIQARLSSTRLPRKVLKILLEKPMLQQQIERIYLAKHFDRIIVATSLDPSDDPIETFCQTISACCFRGSLEDVLDRYYQCACRYKADHIIRITADCPLIDPEVIDQVTQTHLIQQNDYTSNVGIETFPDGLDIEIMSFKTLESAWKNANKSSEREHVTAYIRNHPALFKIGNLESKINRAHLRWTVDYEEDFSLVETIYKHFFSCGNTKFTSNDIYALLEKNPALLNINKNHQRNEGYALSLQKELQNQHRPL